MFALRAIPAPAPTKGTHSHGQPRTCRAARSVVEGRNGSSTGSRRFESCVAASALAYARLHSINCALGSDFTSARLSPCRIRRMIQLAVFMSASLCYVVAPRHAIFSPCGVKDNCRQPLGRRLFYGFEVSIASVPRGASVYSHPLEKDRADAFEESNRKRSYP
jgi:hypothetical protein